MVLNCGFCESEIGKGLSEDALTLFHDVWSISREDFRPGGDYERLKSFGGMFTVCDSHTGPVKFMANEHKPNTK